MANTRARRAPVEKTKTGNGMSSENSQLEKLFHDSLKDIYWAEKHLTQELPKMQKAATSVELKDGRTDQGRSFGC